MYTQKRDENTYRNRIPEKGIYIKSQMAAAEHRSYWTQVFAGGLETQELPGDHMDMTKESAIRVWAEYVRRGLKDSNHLLLNESTNAVQKS